jgi:ribonuclease E
VTNDNTPSIDGGSAAEGAPRDDRGAQNDNDTRAQNSSREPNDSGAANGAAAGTDPGPSTEPQVDGENAAPAPRRRATRSRTTKKAVAPVEPTEPGSDPLAPPQPTASTASGANPAGGDVQGSSTTNGSTAGNDSTAADDSTAGDGDTAPAPVKRSRAPRKRAAKKVAASAAEAGTTDLADLATADALSSVAGTEGGAAPVVDPDPAAGVDEPAADTLFADPAPAAEPAKKTTRRRTRKAAAPVESPVAAAPQTLPGEAPAAGEPDGTREPLETAASATQTPEPGETVEPVKSSRSRSTRSRRGSAERAAAAAGDTAAGTDTPLAAEARPSATSGRSGAPTSEAPEPASSGSASSGSVPSETVPSESVSSAGVSSAPESSAPPAGESGGVSTPAVRGIMPLFQAPEPVAPRPRRAASRPAGPPKVTDPTELPPAEAQERVELDVTIHAESADVEELEEQIIDDLIEVVEELTAPDEVDESEEIDEGDEAEGLEEDESAEAEEGGTPRRRRRRGGRGRRGRGRAESDTGDEESSEEPAAADAGEAGDEDDEPVAAEGEEEAEEGSSGSRRRRRRRRRGAGGDGEAAADEGPARVVTRVRESRDDVTAIRGSTRLEAKKQRRREGREAGRRRSILTEAEFLTRRESVDRVMVVREREGRTQIGVLEDKVLVEHYVARKTQTSTVGNVYLGRVQNVLPSMEAAFIDIGKGRNAVLYAGEVNWDAAGLDGQPRRIEHALKAGESVLVQVTKDPIGHKGARLTSQISMPGRYLVYVPDGSMTGISRKLPDTERSRLKKILREIVPDDAGVIVRTAAEGASDEELERDVARLRAQWDDISAKIATVQAPAMLYGEPDLAIKVVRDIFNEDFGRLIVSGDEAWETLQGYISHVAPDLAPRLERWESDQDVFAAHRIDEQLAKAMDRKVWLPSGGSLVIDRTEAMTVVDVNTGKFVGAGGNLEETVTKNNLEAAEEVVHQLRLRDIGGIIVVDFIDMVLESNRDLVLRRLLECLGRDRTRHQVAEVTSLGLVQMTRKRVGQGLLEVFSETCEHCGGRGLVIHDEPVEKRQVEVSTGGGNSRNRRH